MRAARFFSGVLLTVAAWTSLGADAAETRVALVIGNGDYASSPLANPVRDAQLIRDTLSGLGFKVTYEANADRRHMIRDIQTLGQQLSAAGKDGVGLFYFSGHGVQSDGENYLLPEAVNADWVLKQMEDAGNGLNILILDACRNNTLQAKTRSATKGLARMIVPVGSVLAYATDSGTVAYDGRDHSPYAVALSRYMKQPGLELKAMFDDVAHDVYASTQNESVPQVPVQLYKLTPAFYFVPEAGTQVASLTLPPVPASAPAPTPAYTPIRAPPPPSSPGNSFRDCSDCPEMVHLAAGSFMMGSPADEEDRSSIEGPRHQVHVPTLSIGKYDVTFDEWDACVAAGGCRTRPSDQGWGRGRRPVINVSWEDAQQYAQWLSRKTGQTYRLPSEAEWEYAARAGTTTAYCWGVAIGRGNADCGGCGSQWDNEQTAPVGSFPSNSWGLYDMTGNVYQWTQDCYQYNYVGAPTDGSARQSCTDMSSRVLRGGGWDNLPRYLRSAYRVYDPAAVRYNDSGFRLARTG